MRVGTVLTVRVNFDAKRHENQNLILAIVLCRNFIFKELVHWYYLQEKKIKFIDSLAN